MQIIINSTLKTLEKSKYLLDNLNDSSLSDTSVSPYYSSIGTHIRHILDFYECIFNINSNNQIDLTSRSRNKQVESECKSSKQYLNTIIQKLKNFDKNMDETVSVFDDLGLGQVEIPYTYGALFSQANSHTIHHYAIINYILNGLNLAIKDCNFGYNPTTLKQQV
ncbi:hypothetical protein ACFQ1R_02885 [Mariniflexile jejuense]|uniref:DinB family protein n=1 Tax=Mariniflexile jejuense TaxID=1173582 RepID=A0ABW3JEX0_9FLAO